MTAIKLTGALSMGGEPVERLMEIILQMRMNMAHINETLQQQTFEICRELSTIFNDQKDALDGYLDAIDVKLKECARHFDDFHRLSASLAETGAKLNQFGVTSGPLAAPSPDETLEGFLAWRVSHLKEIGKI
jgi:hypothetical protein